MAFWIIGAVGVFAIALVGTNWRRVTWEIPNEPFPAKWRSILVKEIDFYNGLTSPEKKSFEFKVQEFLLNCRITGIETTVDLTDRLMVASSAVIPILKFPKWHYTILF